MKEVIVIKFGGQFIRQKQYFIPLLEAIAEFYNKGFSIIIVHGGGPQADRMQIKLGIPIRKINGKRITDSRTLEVAKMVYKGSVNLDIVINCIKLKISAVGISGVDSCLAMSEKRPLTSVLDQKTGKTKRVDFGYVGDIKYINVKLLEILLKEGYLPVVACIGVSGTGEILNINADTLASHIALALKANKLIFVTDVKGVSDRSNKGGYFQSISLKDAKELIQKGVIVNGMIPKIENIEKVLSGGIKTVIVGGVDTKEKWMDTVIKDTFGTVITKN